MIKLNTSFSRDLALFQDVLMNYVLQIISRTNCDWPPFFIDDKIRTTDCRAGRCGRERMVGGFITTYAIRAYHH